MSYSPSSRQRYASFVRRYRSNRLDEPDSADRDAGADAPDESALTGGADRPRPARGQLLGRYLRWLAPHGRAVAAVFALALGVAALQLVEPLFMRFLIDRVLLDDSLSREARLRLLHTTGLLFLALTIASNLLGAVRDLRQKLLNLRLMLALRESLFDRMLHLPLSTLFGLKTGGILSRLTGDVDTTTGLLQLAIVSPAISLVRVLVALGVLFTLNWRLAITALAIMPGVIAISFVSARRIRPIYRSLRKDAEQIDGRVAETFGGIRVVRTFRREKSELLGYLRGRHTVVRKELFAQRREMVIWTSWGLLLGGVNVVIMWFGGYLNVAGRASVGDIMAFQWYTFLLLTPVWNLVNSFSELQRSLAAMDRVFQVLDLPADKPDQPGAIAAPPVVHRLEFQHVHFAYDEGPPVISDFDVTVPGGSVVALVGRSGAGKTTITDLVARFHDPTSGRILLDGRDIREFRLRSYRDLLAIVQQDVFLFDGSVRDNIAYGRQRATDAQIEHAARQANAHEFISRLPEGYDTLVGERGVRLSGGQQQRLAIARALLAAPQILILDEATSNLDTESEMLIQASLETLLEGRTTFVIAHRLSTIRRADLILLMDEGRILERGTHDELMLVRGAYYEMVMRQMTASDDMAVPAEPLAS